MARWTNDKWLSTLHRVVNPIPTSQCTNSTEDGVDTHDRTCIAAPISASTRRQSMAFFYNLDKDAVVSTLPSSHLGDSQYVPIVAGDFLMMKHLASIKASESAA